ncbi:hypothetical protein Q5752_005402 [Cryptotrichosporon argae]
MRTRTHTRRAHRDVHIPAHPLAHLFYYPGHAYSPVPPTFIALPRKGYDQSVDDDAMGGESDVGNHSVADASAGLGGTARRAYASETSRSLENGATVGAAELAVGTRGYARLHAPDLPLALYGLRQTRAGLQLLVVLVDTRAAVVYLPPDLYRLTEERPSARLTDPLFVRAEYDPRKASARYGGNASDGRWGKVVVGRRAERLARAVETRLRGEDGENGDDSRDADSYTE